LIKKINLMKYINKKKYFLMNKKINIIEIKFKFGK